MRIVVFECIVVGGGGGVVVIVVRLMVVVMLVVVVVVAVGDPSLAFAHPHTHAFEKV